MAPIDGKQIVNTIYLAVVETVLTVGYADISKKLFKRSPPKVDFYMSNIGK